MEKFHFWATYILNSSQDWDGIQPHVQDWDKIMIADQDLVIKLKFDGGIRIKF